MLGISRKPQRITQRIGYDAGVFNKRDGVVVQGYIRREFSRKYMIDAIVRTIIQFYMSKGGSLYVCGDGKYGKLGLKGLLRKCREPKLCPPFHENNCIGIATCSNHPLALDIDGSVWSCGLGINGALGNGKTTNVEVMTKISMSDRAIAVSVGSAHSLVLFENGRMQSFGGNMVGQLGHGNKEFLRIPKDIESLTAHTITQISAGASQSAAISDEGLLFMWGYAGSDGILSPNKVEFKGRAAVIECGGDHSLLITTSNLIYSFGDGPASGHGTDGNSYDFVPKLIAALQKRQIISCAAGSRHSLCIDDEGIVYSFGRNYEGQLGHGDTCLETQLTPKCIQFFAVNNIKAKECEAGGAQSCVITESGELYVFGRNASYQLGLPNVYKILIPTELSLPKSASIKKVSMGNGYTAFITEMIE